jgi:hypothetical protein
MAAKLIDAEIRSTCAGMGSTMGKQIPSTRKTAPAVSFGTADKSANPKSKRYMGPGADALSARRPLARARRTHALVSARFRGAVSILGAASGALQSSRLPRAAASRAAPRD